MFSWSKTATKHAGSNDQYPGRRIQRNSTSNIHTPVAGSIRPPSSDFTRAQHLQSYLEDATLQRSTRRVSSDDTTYDTVFQTTDGATLILRVNLPLASSFASGCPAMTLAGVRVRHSWVDNRMRIVGYDPIQSESAWKSSNLLLGKAVHAVVQCLQLNPPEILEITDQGLKAIQPKQQQQQQGGGTNGRSNNNNHSSDAPPGYHVVQQQNQTTKTLSPAPKVPMPDIPKKFSELDDKTREEMEELLSDELEFLAVVHKLDVFQEIQHIGSSKLKENAQLAESNLQSEAQLKSLHLEVHQLLQESLQPKVERFHQLEAKQNALCAPPDQRSMLKALKVARKEAFDESEAFAEEWVEDGGQTVDEFVKAFVEKRKVHHLRAATMEILEQQNFNRLI